MNLKNNKTVDYIESINKFKRVQSLKSVLRVLEILGNPQCKINVVHIAGTNGKGSTAAFLAEILKESGYNVGLFTSPYLETFNERIKINNENISDSNLDKYLELVKKATKQIEEEGYESLTQFEIVTVIGFCYFKENNIDVAIIEVGLGGTFDATNVLEKSLVDVITSIDLDHTEILGNTIEEIAKEKAGIIKKNGNVVLYSQEKNTENIIKNMCKDLNADIFITDLKQLNIIKRTISSLIFSYKEKEYKLRMLGEYQAANCTVVIEVLNILINKYGFSKIDEESIKRGFLNTRWNCRMEKVCENPLTIIDGAHNKSGSKMLANEIKELLSDYSIILVLGIMKDKDVDSIIKNLVPLCETLITTLPDEKRGMDVGELANRSFMHCDDIVCIENIEIALDYAKKTSIELMKNNRLENKNNNSKSNKSKGKKHKNDKKKIKNVILKKEKAAIIIAGSLYLAGTSRSIIMSEDI